MWGNETVVTHHNLKLSEGGKREELRLSRTVLIHGPVVHQLICGSLMVIWNSNPTADKFSSLSYITNLFVIFIYDF